MAAVLALVMYVLSVGFVYSFLQQGMGSKD